MAFVKTVDDAFEFIRTEVQRLTEKVEIKFQKPKQLIPYDTSSDILKYNCDNLSVSGQYLRNSGTKQWYYTTDAVSAREQGLLSAIDTLQATFDAVHAENQVIIEHNKEVVKFITTMMKELGIPDTYQEQDLKSRARLPKYIKRDAGYKGDILRNIKTVDAQYNSLKNKLETKRKEVTTWATKTRAEIAKKQQEQQKIQKEQDGAKLLAMMQVKYGLQHTDGFREVLDALFQRNKYLRLGHFLYLNRSDWNDGYSFAERGLDGFSIDYSTLRDQEIYDDITECIDEWDGDGRVFRDTKWSYDALFTLVDSDLMDDYTKISDYLGYDQ